MPRNWREEFGVEAIHLDEIPAEHFDLIINGTTTGLKHDAPPIDPETFDDCTLAYDLVYAADPTPFMELARGGGAKNVCDGLGMLIEQAAESFLLWRGVRPDTASRVPRTARTAEPRGNGAGNHCPLADGLPGARKWRRRTAQWDPLEIRTVVRWILRMRPGRSGAAAGDTALVCRLDRVVALE